MTQTPTAQTARTRIIFCAATLGLLALCLSSVIRPTPSLAQERKVVSYKVIKMLPRNFNQLERDLNALATDGWRVKAALGEAVILEK